jgi:hypothetical protein
LRQNRFFRLIGENSFAEIALVIKDRFLLVPNSWPCGHFWERIALALRSSIVGSGPMLEKTRISWIDITQPVEVFTCLRNGTKIHLRKSLVSLVFAGISLAISCTGNKALCP